MTYRRTSVPRGTSRRTLSVYIEAVHRLSDLGAVVTQVLNGDLAGGFRGRVADVSDLLTVDGDLFNRCELFDEADLDAALARFDELSRPAPRLENAASRVIDRFPSYFAARDWDAMAEILADDISSDDRRRVVAAGVRHGRDAEIANVRAIADIGVDEYDVGPSLRPAGSASSSACPLLGPRSRSRCFLTEVLSVFEIDADDRIAAVVIFDPDDIDAAFEELDARYLAGEAADHSHTWSVITHAYAALNRRELAATTPDWVNIDHRRGIAVARGDLTPYIRAAWDVMPRHQGTHRDCASTDQPRSGRHPRVERDLTRGLRRRVAGDRRY